MKNLNRQHLAALFAAFGLVALTASVLVAQRASGSARRPSRRGRTRARRGAIPISKASGRATTTSRFRSSVRPRRGQGVSRGQGSGGRAGPPREADRGGPRRRRSGLRSSALVREPDGAIARSSLIIDPPNGRLPALTAEARSARRAAADARRGPRTVGLLGGSQPLGPLHHRRTAERDVSDRLQQQRPDPPGARRRHDHARDDARHACHPARRPAARLSPAIRQLHGRLPRALGRHDAGDRRHQLPSQDQLPRIAARRCT